MNRTKEFLLLAAATSIPQRPQVLLESSSLISILTIEEDLQTLERAVDVKKTPSKELIERVEALLEALLLQHSKMQVSTEFEQSIAKAVQRKHTALMLRLTALLGRHREHERARTAQMLQEEQEHKRRAAGEGQESQMHCARREIQREEISSIRRREFESLEQHINELGRMVTEVSMHISLQGEKVEMVDGLFAKTKSNMRSGAYEIKSAQEKVNQKRKTIILVFAVLFGILGLKCLRWI